MSLHIEISQGVKFRNLTRDSDHAPFSDRLPSSDWDLLWSTHVTNLVSIFTRHKDTNSDLLKATRYSVDVNSVCQGK